MASDMTSVNRCREDGKDGVPEVVEHGEEDLEEDRGEVQVASVASNLV